MDPLEIEELAVISREYHENQTRIIEAVKESLHGGETLDEVCKKFGIPRSFARKYGPGSQAPRGTKRGQIYRRGLKKLEDVVEEIERDIHRGRWLKGSMLPNSKYIAVQYHCNDNVAMRAKRVLAERGMVERRQSWYVVIWETK